MSRLYQENLLPYFDDVLCNIENKKYYQINDSVMFMSFCIKFGNNQLFDRVKQGATSKLIEAIGFGFGDIMTIKHILIQSSLQALGALAVRSPSV